MLAHELYCNGRTLKPLFSRSVYSGYVQVVAEMRKQQEEQQANLVCSVDPDAAMVAYQRALENSQAAPHPVDGYGQEGNSLAAARRKVLSAQY
jgi:hypothetical protein